MTTIQQIQQIQQEIKTLPEYARKEVFDFVLFLKEKEQKAYTERLKPSVAQELKQAKQEWENGDVHKFETTEDVIKFLDDMMTTS